MTKNKHKPSIYTDKTCSDILLYDLNGKVHTFNSENIYSISIFDIDEGYRLEYIDCGSKQAVPINEDQFNVLKDIIKNKGHNLMTEKETIELQDNILSLQDIDSKKHVFRIEDIYALVLLSMDSHNNCSIEYLSSEKDEHTGLPIMEEATITKKQFDALKDILDKTRYKQ